MNPRDSHTDYVPSKFTGKLQDAIKSMEIWLISWRKSVGGGNPCETNRHLDGFLLSSYEGYRLMAIGQGNHGDVAKDIAQTCVLQLIKRNQLGFRPPLVPRSIDSLLGDEPLSDDESDSGTPLAAYLYGVLSRGVGAQTRTHRMRANRTRPIEAIELDEKESDPSEVSSYSPRRPDSVIRNVSAVQNLEFAMRIHDDYLNTTTYKGSTLRVVFADWTPMGEWAGRCSKEDRPKAIPTRTLQRHVSTIKNLIRGAKKTNRRQIETENQTDKDL